MKLRRLSENARVRSSVLTLLAYAGGCSVATADQADVLRELRSLSITELANLEVTSVSRRPESLRLAARNVFVVTSEEISRSGVATVPQALALAPNLQVAGVGAGTHAITARGLNIPSAASANKLLVLVDGRTVYTPLYSGVYWDAQNIPVEDIERIEVLSGPGGTLWGANAVNGVINITTKKASPGERGLTLRGGTFEYGANARQTFSLSDTAALRVYGNAFDRAHSETRTGARAYDSWRNLQTGFRLDLSREAGEATVQGDFYTGYTQPNALTAAPRIGGGNLLGRWIQQYDSSTLQVGAYYDRSERYVSTGIKDRLETAEVTLQQNINLSDTHEAVWGASYRLHHDRFTPGPGTSFLDPASHTMHLASLYGESTVTLNDIFRATFGLKLESNSYTGIEYLPNARLSADLSPTNAVWLSVARAIRMPSRFDRDIRNPGIIAGGTDFQSETVWTYEAGYRTEPLDAVHLSATVFYNQYGRLRTVERAPTGVLPLTVGNGMEGHSYGAEAWANIGLNPGWRLSVGGNYLVKRLRLKPDSRDFFGLGFAGNDPSYQVSIRSYSRLSSALDLYVGLRAVDDLPQPAVADYVEADATLTWRVSDAISVALTGLNLLHGRHTEFVLNGITPLAVSRSGYVTLRTSF